MKKRVSMFLVSIIVIISSFSSILAKDNQNTKLSPDGCFPFTPAQFVQVYNEAMATEDMYISMANLKVSNTPSHSPNQQVYECDFGSHSKLYFTADKKSGRVKSIQLTCPRAYINDHSNTDVEVMWGTGVLLGILGALDGNHVTSDQFVSDLGINNDLVTPRTNTVQYNNVKITFAITSDAVTTTMSACTYSNKQEIKLIVNGEELKLNTAPQVVDNRTLVPVRGIFERLGASVQWDNATQEVIANKGNNIIKLKLGSNKAYINGTEKKLDTPGQSIGGRTMVPLRFVAEALNADVQWDPSSQTITVNERAVNVVAGEIVEFQDVTKN